MGFAVLAAVRILAIIDSKGGPVRWNGEPTGNTSEAHIEAAEDILDLWDEDAIAKAHALSSEREQHFEGVRLVDRVRVLCRHIEATAPNTTAKRDPLANPPAAYSFQRGQIQLSFQTNWSASIQATRLVPKRLNNLSRTFLFS
jgi:hypothetical protein